MTRAVRTWGRPLAALALLAGLEGAAAAESSALELVRSARAHEQAHDDDVALRRYMEALSLDPTCEDAYLGLGSLRARRGDLREAERVYSVALEHVPALRAARRARAHVRRGLGATAEATIDLLTAAEDEVDALKIIATWHGEDGHVPAQLAVWRAIAAKAETTQQPALVREARRMVRALVILVGPADPAASPADEHGIRRTLAALARRGG